MCIEAVSVVSLFSHQVFHTDPTLVEVKKCIKKEMNVDDKKEEIYFEHYNPEELQKVIDTQTKVISYMKNHKLKQLHSILIVVDDHADD